MMSRNLKIYTSETENQEKRVCSQDAPAVMNVPPRASRRLLLFVGALTALFPTVALSQGNNSPNFTSTTTSFNVDENSNISIDVEAGDSDAEDGITGYRLSGADAALFKIDLSTARLSFITAPDYESPQGGTGDNSNTYEITVTVISGTDSREMTADRAITITVGNINEPPVFNSSSPTTNFTIYENTNIFLSVQASDPDDGDNVESVATSQYVLSGADAGLFTIEPSSSHAAITTSVLRFTAVPDYESPQGRTGDDSNTYEITITATGGTGGREMTGDWNVIMTVLDIFEAPDRPSVPAGFTIRAGNTQVTLSWNDPGDASIVKYQYKQDNGAWQDVAGSSSSTVSSTVTGLTNRTRYTFKIRAVNAEGNGPESNTVVATPLSLPGKPAGVMAMPGNTQVTLSWDDPGDASITGYQYQQDNRAWQDVPGSSSSTVSATVTGLTNGTVYAFKIRAVNADGPGPGSDAVMATPPLSPPGKPAGVMALAGNTQVTLSWDDPGDASIARYQYQQGSDSWQDVAGSSSSTVSATVTGLTNGTVYAFKIRAVNEDGDSPESDAVMATPQSSLPDKPAGVMALAGNTRVTLSWDDPGDASITGYQYQQGSDSWQDIAGSSSSTVSTTVTGLTNGTVYAFKIRAVNVAGDGPGSDAVTATPQSSPPGKPAGVMALAGNTQVTLSWDDPGDASITGYQYQQDNGAWLNVAGSSSSTVSTTVTGLTNGTVYAFKIRAVNADGNGPGSDAVMATPVVKPILRYSKKNFREPESQGFAKVTVELNEMINEEVTVDYSMMPGSATEHIDYLPSSGGLTFPPNTLSLTFDVVILKDNLALEPDETIILTLSNPSANVQLNSPTATVTIDDDDVVRMGFSDTEYIVNEGCPCPIVLLKNLATVASFRVDLYTGETSATDGEDFIGGSFEYTFAANAQQRAEFRAVQTLSDNITEPNEKFTVDIDLPLTGRILRIQEGKGVQQATCIIRNRFFPVPPPPLQPAGVAEIAGDSRVTLSWDDPRDASITGYQYLQGGEVTWQDIPGSSSSTVSATVTELANGFLHTFRIRAVSASGPGGPSHAVTTLPQLTMTSARVPTRPIGFQAEINDPGTVILSWRSPQNDGGSAITGYEYSPDGGTTWNSISGSSASTMEHTLTGLTPGLEYLFSVRAVNVAGAGIKSDVIAATPSGKGLIFNDVSIMEGQRLNVNVRLNLMPSGNVMVSLMSNDQEIATVSPATLTFTSTNWDRTQTVTITGADDEIDNPVGQSTSILYEASGGGYDGIMRNVPVTVSDNDTPGLTALPSTVNVSEAGTSDTYTVTLNSQPTGDVTVTPVSSDPDAATVSGALTFAPDNWNMGQTVTVTGVNDDIDNGNSRNVLISYTVSGAGSYEGVNTLSAEVDAIVSNDDMRGVTTSFTELTVTEAGGTAGYTVVLNSQPTGDVTVTPVSSMPSDATVSGMLVFTSGNWSAPQTVTVTGVDDMVVNTMPRTTTISLMVTGADYALVVPAGVVITVTDNDEPGVTVTPQSLTVSEAGGTAGYTVVLTSQPSADVTVMPASDDPAATVSPAILTFTSVNWNMAQTVTVTGIDDIVRNIPDREATISNTVTGTTEYASVTAAGVAITVTDNDRPGVTVTPQSLTVSEAGGMAAYTVVLNSQPSANVTVTPNSNSISATVSDELIFAPDNWNMAQSVTVTGVDDNVDNGDSRTATISNLVTAGAEYASITAAGVDVTLTDDDMAGVTISETMLTVFEAGGMAAYTVVLNSQPSADVTVMPASDDPAVTVSPAILTFTSTDWDMAQTVTVTGVDDNVVNTMPRTATISLMVTGATEYASVTATGVDVTLTDDDMAGVTISETMLTVVEAGGTAAYTVALTSRPSADVTVMPASDSPAVTVSPAILTFTSTDWDMAQTVTVTGVDDNVVNTMPRTATISHTVTGATEYASVTAAGVDVTLTDDDMMAGVTISETMLTVVEAGGTAAYTVVLTSRPSADVTVMPASDSPAATVSPAILTFTSTDWDMAQTVTVTGVDDNVVNTMPRTATISHTVTGVAEYASVTAADVVVDVTDLALTVRGEVNGFVLHPNPGDARINVKAKRPVAFDREWRLLDFSGKKILDGTLPRRKRHLTIHTENLVSGMYFFRILSPDKEWTFIRVSIKH